MGSKDIMNIYASSDDDRISRFHDIEPEARVILDPPSEHRLYISDGLRFHLWLGPDQRPISGSSGRELGSLISDLAGRMISGCALGGDGRHSIKFNMLDEDSARILAGKEKEYDAPISTEKADDGISVRMDIGDLRFTLDHSFVLDRDRMGDYILSRLNSRSNPGVIGLVGFSYWDVNDCPLIWSRITVKDRECIPALRPLLMDLENLGSDFSRLEGERSRSFLLEISGGSRSKGKELSRLLGSQIAEMHLDLVTGRTSSNEGSCRIGDRIVEELSLSRFEMDGVGSLLGRMGHYLSSLKRDLARITGETTSLSSGKRKQKVIRFSPRMDDMRSKGLESMPLLSRKLYQREREIRSRISRLKGLVGSPALTCLLDTSLERAEVDKGGHVLFSRFDWSFSGDENRQLRKVPPIKDLSLALNSLMKARLLNARKALREAAYETHMDPSRLWLMYLEYNLSKTDYDSMRTDFRIRDLIRSKETPFRRVFSQSIIGALWYEICKREMVRSYMDTVSEGDIPTLLDYPDGANISEALSALQIMAALSQINGALSGGRTSIPSIETEMMIILTR